MNPADMLQDIAIVLIESYIIALQQAFPQTQVTPSKMNTALVGFA